MKPAPVRYARPSTIDDAVALLREEDARPLAGGQSLVPMMNFRLARPSLLVDLRRVDGLGRLEVDGDRLVIGAMIRQRSVETSALVAEVCPLLVRALAQVGHLQIRTQGTVVGSLAHADPKAELPVVAIALDAEVVVAGRRGVRTVPARDLYAGPYATTLEPDELIIEVHLPVDARRGSFVEVARRHGDFALFGVAGAVRPTGVVLAATGTSGPVRLRATETLLQATPPDAGIPDGLADAVATDLPMATTTEEGTYAARVAPVLVRRAIEELRT